MRRERMSRRERQMGGSRISGEFGIDFFHNVENLEELVLLFGLVLGNVVL